jgi:excisionase family DNA binding protein
MKTLHLFEITPEELVARVVNELKQSQELATSQTILQPEEYLTVKDVADLFHISIATVNNWRREGIIVAYQIGGKIFFKRSEIENSLVQLKS